MKIIVTITLLFLTASLLSAQEQDKIVSASIKPGQIEVTYNIPAGYHLTLQEDYFFVEAEEQEGITFANTLYPEGQKDAEGNVEYHGQVTLVKKFTVIPEFADKIQTVTIFAGYQMCMDSGTCLFPEEVELKLSLTPNLDIPEESSDRESEEMEIETAKTDSYQELSGLLQDFRITGIETGYHKSDNFARFLEQALMADATVQNAFADKSIWLIIVLILIGGIALNLTPCVLPMIPITIAVLGAGTQAESRGRGFLIGSTYGLGMALAYGALGLIVVLTGSQFGTINSSPWFNVIIAVLFILLALAMFDVIPLDFSRFQSGKVGRKGKFITVFLLGVIAAILAGACVAPVLISVILYSTSLYTAGHTAGLLLPFLLGVGMAIPWPFAGAGLSVLPKPGNWMKWVKIAFGIIIMIIAVYYAFTGYKIFREKTPGSKHIAIVEESSDLTWYHSIQEGLVAAKQDGKPVFIDFWATWCKNCLVMDASTFKEEIIKEKLQDFVLVKYQAENLKSSPTKEILDHFEIIGLPTYIVLHPNE
ncbi:MAG: thioredoxin family protein [Candidatus Cloacimonetes bacterium]|nr:thioredoxin family protein [Candidatus Cloacimonadota bacterium]